MRRALLATVVVLAALTVGAAGEEKWFDAYDRGVEAVRSGNNAAAVQALQAAIAQMPAENATARRRSETFVYVPHFWLGIAKFNTGDTDGAMRAFRTSEQQGVIQNTRYYGDLRDWMGRVVAQQQKDTQGIASEGKKISGAAVKAAVSAQMEAVAAGGDRSDGYRAGLRKLQEARELANTAGTNLAEYRRAADIANEAKQLFAASTEEARKQKAARAAAPPPVRPAVQQPVRQAPPAQQPPAVAQIVEEKPATVTPPVQQPEPEPQQPAALSAAVADARIVVQQYRRRLVDAAAQHKRDAAFAAWAREAAGTAEQWQRTLDGRPSDDVAKRISSDVAARDRELGLRLADLERERAALAAKQPVAPADARKDLEAAFRAFAAGDLDRADAMLTAVISSRPNAQAYLLRGCTRYTQAMLTRSPGLILSRAEGDFRQAVELDRNVRLDPSVFSPKLVAFFEKQRAR